MPFQAIIEPEILAKLTAAFDEAWAVVQSRHTIEATDLVAERERLGHIFVTLWRADPDCPLIEKSVAEFGKTR
ncbi:hypothetical protein [Bosea lathyri]|uniref:hypothetical protein n=1 Tax=Bosea lathyri TaxID=1036778 RepID=UPI0011B07A0F|nr:hypothetical protein [Bosea lathyri]